MSWIFATGGQSIGALASASVLPMNIQGWFPLGLTGLISLESKGLSRVFSSTTIWKHQFFSTQSSLWSSSHIHTWLTTGTAVSLMTIQTFVSKVIFLLFNTLCFRFVIAFLPRNKHVLISWLQLPSAVILEPKKRKSVTASTFSPFYLPRSDGIRCHDLRFIEKASFFTLLFHPHQETL